MPGMPEWTIQAMLKAGVAAVDADTLADILDGLDAATLARVKAYWITNPLSIQLGYPVRDPPIPALSIVLHGEEVSKEFLGLGEMAQFIGEDRAGNEYRKRIKGSFGLYLYAQSPDVCTWYYRVLRRILHVGIQYLMARGYDEPTFSGEELVLEPKYDVMGLFVRRLVLSFEWEEAWDDQGALWTALNGAPTAPIDEIEVRHEDVDGGVHPYVEGE